MIIVRFKKITDQRLRIAEGDHDYRFILAIDRFALQKKSIRKELILPTDSNYFLG